MKCAVIGGVQSTAVLIYALHKHGFKNVHVWGFEPDDTANVSGWADIHQASMETAFEYSSFQKVIECHDGLLKYAPDVLFVVGLSQLVPQSMLEIARFLNVGFHPTALPKGRGRAAIAWLIINECDGAATFFQMKEGVDDGPILAQVPFIVSANDYAFDVEQKILEAEVEALDYLLPRLKEKNLEFLEQDHQKATWFGKRAPEDGWIDWTRTSEEILKIVRASSKPHPGAYTFCGDYKIFVWKAARTQQNELGVAGRILHVQADSSFIVQTGEGLIHVEEWSADSSWHPRVGMKLGFYLELENFELRQQISDLRSRIEMLERVQKNRVES